MSISLYALTLQSVFLILNLGSSSVQGKIVDLTHKLNSQSMHYQLFNDFKLESAIKGNQENLGGMWVEANDVSFSEHTGTHVDAPVHTWETGVHIDEIAADDLVGPAVVIDVTTGVTKNRDYVLTVQDVQKFEETHGRMANRSIVFIYTNGAKDYWDHKAYLGTDTPNDAASMHFPGFSGESIEWLIENRNIRGIGLDRMSLDAGQNTGHPAHISLLSKGCFGIENVNSLHLLPPTGATVYVAALPFENGSGAPARIFAVVEDEESDSHASAGVPQGSVFMLIWMAVVLTLML